MLPFHSAFDRSRPFIALTRQLSKREVLVEVSAAFPLRHLCAPEELEASFFQDTKRVAVNIEAHNILSEAPHSHVDYIQLQCSL